MIFKAKQSQCMSVLNQNLETFSIIVTFSFVFREWSLCRTIQTSFLAQITLALVPISINDFFYMQESNYI